MMLDTFVTNSEMGFGREANLVSLFSAIWSLLAAFRQTTPYKNEL